MENCYIEWPVRICLAKFAILIKNGIESHWKLDCLEEIVVYTGYASHLRVHGKAVPQVVHEFILAIGHLQRVFPGLLGDFGEHLEDRVHRQRH